MRAAIVGGALQGTEAAYLARRAGWETLLVDKRPRPPAAGLCNDFRHCDVVSEGAVLAEVLRDVDLIIPALENASALCALEAGAAAAGVPLALDLRAYVLAHSKKRSNRLFRKLGVPAPEDWPSCGLPVIAKPSAASGSRGVRKLGSEDELDTFLERAGPGLKGWVLQEYVEGPSYSVEVLGLPGHYAALQVTELEVDGRYDCNRVVAPADIPERLESEIRQIALTIADHIGLKGIMDVEVIVSGGIPKVLEIDARLPSQTPTAVYESTGVNMLELIRDIFCGGFMPGVDLTSAPRGIVYEHLRASRGGLEFPGEHAMREGGRLEIVPDFFGADTAITNFCSSRLPWVATLITTGDSRQQAWLRRRQVIDNIRSHIEELAGPVHASGSE